MSKMRHLEPYRLVEWGSIALFCLAAVLLSFANPSSTAPSPVPVAATDVEACALARPNGPTPSPLDLAPCRQAGPERTGLTTR